MADSDIVVSDLKVTPGIGHNALRYSTDDPHEGGWLNQSLDVVEVWAAATAWTDIANATKVAEGNKTNALHVALVEGQTWHYRVRARSRAVGLNGERYYGDFEPALGSAAVQGTVGFASSSVFSLINGKIDVSVAGNALTLSIKTLSGDDPSALNPVTFAFRDVTLTSGAPVIVQITAATSLTVSSGSTLGTTNNAPFRVWCVLINDDGTPRIGATVRSDATSVRPLAEEGLISTAAEGGVGGADTLGIVYSNVAVVAKPYRVITYLEWQSGLPTAGTWSAAPTLVHMVGPSSKMPGDVVQTRTDFSSSYASGVIDIPYDNTAPQSSEGQEVIGASISVSSPSNLVRKDFSALASRSTAGPVIAALFGLNDGASALLTVSQSAAADVPVTLTGSQISRAGASAGYGWSVRLGATGGATLYINGNSAGALFGGTAGATLTITEIMA